MPGPSMIDPGPAPLPKSIMKKSSSSSNFKSPIKKSNPISISSSPSPLYTTSTPLTELSSSGNRNTSPTNPSPSSSNTTRNRRTCINNTGIGPSPVPSSSKLPSSSSENSISPQTQAEPSGSTWTIGNQLGESSKKERSSSPKKVVTYSRLSPSKGHDGAEEEVEEEDIEDGDKVIRRGMIVSDSMGSVAMDIDVTHGTINGYDENDVLKENEESASEGDGDFGGDIVEEEVVGLHTRERSNSGLELRRVNGHGRDGGENQEEEEEEEEEDEDEMMSDEEEPKMKLHIEIRRSPSFQTNEGHLLQMLRYVFDDKMESTFLRIGSQIDVEDLTDNPMVLRSVEQMVIAESEPPMESVRYLSTEVLIRWHFYRLATEPDPRAMLVATDDDEMDEQVPAATIKNLPCRQNEGLWESLVYADGLKPRLLNYVAATLSFSEAQIDSNIVSWNRLVLLHGPPGTGKTSLCRALSQKLLIRMSSTYPKGKLVEINSHSLFSKWFSESGKLVQKLFSNITDMIQDSSCFVVVMIDEVESLTAARSAAMNGTEPSDALRVVNALLTQLDKLKNYQNVLIMSTSNIPDSIDSAFIDRADEKFFVDYPPPEAVYWIISGCIEEVWKKGILKGLTEGRLSTFSKATMYHHRLANYIELKHVGERISLDVFNLAWRCHNNKLAGRFLRRLPLLARARYLKSSSGGSKAFKVEKWIEAMKKVVEDEIRDRELVSKKTRTEMGAMSKS